MKGFNHKIRFMYMYMNKIYQLTAHAVEDFNTFSKLNEWGYDVKKILLFFDMLFTTNRDTCKF